VVRVFTQSLRGLVIKKSRVFSLRILIRILSRPHPLSNALAPLRTFVSTVCQSFQFPIHFFVADFDFFQIAMRSSSKEDFTSLTAWSRWPARSRGSPSSSNLPSSCLALPALAGRAPDANRSAVDQRFRHLKIIALYQFGHQFVFRGMLGVWRFSASMFSRSACAPRPGCRNSPSSLANSSLDSGRLFCLIPFTFTVYTNVLPASRLSAVSSG